MMLVAPSNTHSAYDGPLPLCTRGACINTSWQRLGQIWSFVQQSSHPANAMVCTRGAMQKLVSHLVK
jgi:hypothetical protein